MDPIALAREVENDYRLYLRTSFYFKDPDLRAGFERALKSEGLSKGPYLEATPVFKRGQHPGPLFQSLQGSRPDEGFLSALHSERHSILIRNPQSVRLGQMRTSSSPPAWDRESRKRSSIRYCCIFTESTCAGNWGMVCGRWCCTR